MAKSRVTTNPMYVGGAGGYSFYVRGGEQVIRQRKNNSNYGEGASRTMAQMIRRIRWGNLVNVFKSQKSWQPKAYDSKTKGQTDYNIFMALNINQATVGFTKEMCEAGCAVIEGYQVSRGSLPPIALSASQSGSYYVTDIKLTITISGTTTVGQLAADIIANNSQFVEGDNIALIGFKNWLTSRTEWPYAASSYAEITLDSTSTALVSSITGFGSRLSKDTNGNLQVSWSSTGQYDPTREVGFVAIHTRKSASMLAVSSQEILMNSNSLVGSFSGTAWDNQCILSYGLTDEVPLEPSFKGAVIRNVAVNGSDVPGIYGHILTYDQPVELVITGIGMKSDNVYLEHDGVRYTPLEIDGDKWTYILEDNGTNRIYVNGSFYGGIAISDIVVPDTLPASLNMSQASNTSAAPSYINGKTFTGNCINYPYKAVEDYPCFQLFINMGSAEDFPEADFVGVNCTLSWYSSGGGASVKIGIEPTEASKLCYIKYQGFIIAVFNYSE